MRNARYRWLVAIIALMSLVAASCGGDDDDNNAATPDVDSNESGEVPEGGTLIIGAEQEPACVDWISSCAGASWGYWTMNVTTMPRAYAVEKKGDNWEYVATSLLAKDAELKTSPKQTVTYTISPDAKWSDGTPITSSDFKYTWEQIATGDDIYDTTGYANIESVDDSKPNVAVVTFKEVFADWKGLFGGGYGIYPSHLLEGKDRNAEMANGYTFSGGPWKIESWNKGVDVTLVPNESYWDDKPKLDKVVFRFITDTSAQFQAFKAAETMVIYPQPQPDVIDQINVGLDFAESNYTADTGNIESLWFHNGKPPFDDPKVRQAWGYAIDRPQVVQRLFGDLGVDEPMQSLNPPILSKYSDTDAWAGYKKDLAKVDELMKSAGWAKGSDGVWAKGGQKFNATFKTTTGNKRRELTLQIVQEQLKAAGFPTAINPQKAGDLFGDQLPKGDFEVALYAQVATTLSPTNCNLFCSKNIPTPPAFTGQNWQRINLPSVDPLLNTVDTSLDEDKRAEAQRKADKILAAQNVALPLDPLPNILLWNKKVIGPRVGNPVLGPFYELHKWGVRQ